jgi:hypothetical protein
MAPLWSPVGVATTLHLGHPDAPPALVMSSAIRSVFPSVGKSGCSTSTLKRAAAFSGEALGPCAAVTAAPNAAAAVSPAMSRAAPRYLTVRTLRPAPLCVQRDRAVSGSASSCSLPTPSRLTHPRPHDGLTCPYCI